MRRLTIALLGVLAASLFAASARADDSPSLHLEWDAPVGCPTRERVLARIAELGEGLAGGEVTARVAVTAPVTGTWSAHVFVRRNGLESDRTLTASSCAEVVDGAVVVIALVLGPSEDSATAGPTSADRAAEGLTSTPPTQGPEAPSREVRIATPSPPLAADVQAPRSSASPIAGRPVRPVLGVAAVGLVEAAILPGVSYGIGGLVSASMQHLRLEAGADVFADRAMAIAAAPGSEGHFGFWSMHAGACWLMFPVGWRPGWCAELEWGQMSGRAIGGGVSTVDVQRTWLAVASGPYLEWSPAGGVSILARAGAVLPLTPTTFAIDAIDVYRPGVLGARLLAGGELRF